MAFAPAGFSAGTTTNYAGLVYSGSPNSGAQSGLFTMSVSGNRKFSGRMQVAERSVGFSGRFDTNGAADVVVKVTIDVSCYICDPTIPMTEEKSIWNVHFQLSPGGDGISGGFHFRHGDFPDGTLLGKRSSFSRNNPIPSDGDFTFALGGSGDPVNTNFPTGNGFGTVTINSSGKVKIAGSLPDKWAFSGGTLLCDDGTFPVFAPLYSGKGMLQGWAGLTNTPSADLAGDVVWVKPSSNGHSFFPAGFTNEVMVIGSRYVQTSPLLNWTSGAVVFQGGKLAAPFTNSILLDAKGKVVNSSDNKLTLKIQTKSGQFKGSVKEPLTGDNISFMGVLLQNESGGFGYFPDAPLSGQVSLGPVAQ